MQNYIRPKVARFNAAGQVDIDLAGKRLERLETRDKELREKIQEIRDGAQIGICADLCPEKERYRRWVQQDISGKAEKLKLEFQQFQEVLQ